jgi:hypothetical protein
MEQQHLPQEQTGEEARSRIHSDEKDLTTGEANVEPMELEVVSHLGSVLRRDTRRRLVSLVLLPLLPFALLLTLKLLLSEEAWLRLCTNPVFVVVAILVGIGAPLTLLRPSRKARQATRRLSTLEDVRAIGGLVETLYFNYDLNGDAPAREALIRLLPRLQASDSGLLTERHAAWLRQMLNALPYATGNPFRRFSQRLSRRQDALPRLQIAILKAFEQVGDSNSLPAVDHLARRAANPEVRKAAGECLPFLQARLEQERAVQTLLRAASASEPDPGILLRPVRGDRAQDPDALVRPSAAPEPDLEAEPGSPEQARFGLHPSVCA